MTDYADGLPDLASIGRRAWQLLGVALLMLLVGWLLAQVAVVTISVILALLLVAAFQPVHARLVARGTPSTVSALLVVVGFFLLLGVVFAVVGWRVVEQLPQLGEQVSQALDRLREQYPGLGVPQGQLSDLPNQIGSGSVLSGATTAAKVLTGAALAVVLSFFLLNDGVGMWDRFVALWDEQTGDRIDTVGRAAYGVMARYVRALTVVALADAVLIGIGLAVLGVPLTLPLAALTFLAAYIPTVGALVIGTLAVLVAFAEGGIGMAVATGVLYLAVQQLDGNVLQPQVMGRELPLHPAAVLVALTTGGVVAGVAGALLAVPLTAAGVAGARAYAQHGTGADTTDRGREEPG